MPQTLFPPTLGISARRGGGDRGRTNGHPPARSGAALAGVGGSGAGTERRQRHSLPARAKVWLCRGEYEALPAAVPPPPPRPQRSERGEAALHNRSHRLGTARPGHGSRPPRHAPAGRNKARRSRCRCTAGAGAGAGAERALQLPATRPAAARPRCPPRGLGAAFGKRPPRAGRERQRQLWPPAALSAPAAERGRRGARPGRSALPRRPRCPAAGQAIRPARASPRPSSPRSPARPAAGSSDKDRQGGSARLRPARG